MVLFGVGEGADLVLVLFDLGGVALADHVRELVVVAHVAGQVDLDVPLLVLQLLQLVLLRRVPLAQPVSL